MCPKFPPGVSQDKPGEIPGTKPGSSQDQPDKTNYVYVPFSCLKNAKKIRETQMSKVKFVRKIWFPPPPKIIENEENCTNQSAENPENCLFSAGAGWGKRDFMDTILRASGRFWQKEIRRTLAVSEEKSSSVPEGAASFPAAAFLAGVEFRAAGKSGKNFPAASRFAGKPFQQGISDSHSLFEFLREVRCHCTYFGPRQNKRCLRIPSLPSEHTCIHATFYQDHAP